MKEVLNPELEIAQKEAFSFLGSTSHMKCIGAVESKEGRIRVFYKDDNGEYWYTTRFRVGDRIVSEEEYIFGRKLPKKQWKKYSYK